MATPMLMRYSAQQQAHQHKKPVGMHCDTSNQLLKTELYEQLNALLGLSPTANVPRQSRQNC